MGEARPRVLFVGHDASRTGAPVVGLAFVRWLAAQGVADLGIALLGTGPLEPDYRQVAPTTVQGARPWALDALAQRGPLHRPRRPRPPAADPQVVVANTLAALAPAAALDAPRLVCWVHELDGVADRILPPARRRKLAPRVHRWVAAGPRVAEMLVERWGLPAARVVTVEEFVEPPAAAPASSTHAGPHAAPHAGPARPVRVLGVGACSPRKGVDAFVACLADLSTRRPTPAAAWVGGRADSVTAREARHDLERSGLAHAVRLEPDLADLEPWWPRRGLLLHPAREDPFPLVVIEAGQRAIPVVTWDTGGAADLLRRAGLADWVAEPGDLLGLSRRVEALLEDHDARAAAGRALYEVSTTLVAEHQAPRVWAACVEAL